MTEIKIKFGGRGKGRTQCDGCRLLPVVVVLCKDQLKAPELAISLLAIPI